MSQPFLIKSHSALDLKTAFCYKGTKTSLLYKKYKKIYPLWNWKKLPSSSITTFLKKFYLQTEQIIIMHSLWIFFNLLRSLIFLVEYWNLFCKRRNTQLQIVYNAEMLTISTSSTSQVFQSILIESAPRAIINGEISFIVGPLAVFNDFLAINQAIVTHPS